MIDSIQSLSAEKNSQFVADRYGNEGDAVRVTNSSNYLTAQPNAYYKNDFTVMGWVKFNENLPNQAFVDFSVEHERINTWRFFLKERTMRPCFEINNEFLTSKIALSENEWYHLAFLVEGVQGRMFVNGEVVVEKELFSEPSYVWRHVRNYVGRSHMLGRIVSNADFDEIKIFNRSLSKEEIEEEMAGLNLILEL
jgi:hypothetical protein